ncbi:hypothetical protein LOD99_4827 [Oopsacas minuta]|uniref:alpha-1,2-Mannosidase n=1 Tax=Oopsacas minuta TaxID=111878 RepID=A0AAV7JSU5_9METZ|nr:hypothetical protein LOD99_4827 [Oopsacas minuta]
MDPRKVDVESNIQINHLQKRKQIRRVWNSLTSFQKNIILMLFLFSLLVYYLFFTQIISISDSALPENQAIDRIFTDYNNLFEEQNENVQTSEFQSQTSRSYPPITPTRNHISESILTDRQKAVVSAMKHAWNGYVEYAWGKDMLKPISRSSQEWFGLGLTLIDALDTLFIMNLTSEFKQARDWVQHSLNFDRNIFVNLFETTIRVLGGLLSSYYLSRDPIFLEKARILGDKLMPSFNTPSGIPRSDVNLHTGVSSDPKWDKHSTVSEVTSIQLEFKYLSYLTGDKMYSDAVERVMIQIQSLPKTDFLVPQFISADTGDFKPGARTLTMGSRADSYYEYLLKQWIMAGKTDDRYREWYLQTVDGVTKRLLRYSEPSRLALIGEIVNNQFSPKMDHLVCFYPGTLTLGYYHGLSPEHLILGKELAYTCYQMYARTATKLSPEIVYFNLQSGGGEDIIIRDLDAHNLLRPETVESLYYLYKVTGDRIYQEWGWEIFNAFEKITRIATGGYSSINNVRSETHPHYRDLMESFFLGETLKYLFLLFSEDESLLPLNSILFNTEAHIIPILQELNN